MHEHLDLPHPWKKRKKKEKKEKKKENLICIRSPIPSFSWNRHSKENDQRKGSFNNIPLSLSILLSDSKGTEESPMVMGTLQKFS